MELVGVITDVFRHHSRDDLEVDVAMTVEQHAEGGGFIPGQHRVSTETAQFVTVEEPQAKRNRV